jgi:ferritin
MLKKEILKVLNKQISMEEYAYRSYLNLAIQAELMGFDGAGKFLYAQSEEERGHMNKIIRYVMEAGSKPVLSTFEEELKDAKNFNDLFEIAMGHEKAVTKAVHKITQMAWEAKDIATFSFMQWFVTEQVEEENQFQSILDKIDIIAKHGGSLYMLDRELGTRPSK